MAKEGTGGPPRTLPLGGDPSLQIDGSPVTTVMNKPLPEPGPVKRAHLSPAGRTLCPWPNDDVPSPQWR